MKRRFRLTSSADFQCVRQQGKSYAHPLLVLVALPNQAERIRCGVAAGRSVGKAVQRNRAKRLLRSAIGPHLPALAPGWDIILIARHPILKATFGQTQAALLTLLQKARLLQEINDLRLQ